MPSESRAETLTAMREGSSPSGPGRDLPIESLPGERTLSDFVAELVDASETSMRSEGIFTDFEDWVDAYWGDTQPEPGPSYRSKMVVNELKQLFLQEVSDLVDGRLRIFVSRDDLQGGRDEKVERSFQAQWDRSRVLIHVIDALLWSLISPVGYLTALYDSMERLGQGDLVVSSRHPWSVKPAPTALDDRKWPYVVLEDILALDDIQDHWPERGGLVKPEAGLELQYGAESYRPYATGFAGYYGPMSPQVGNISNTPRRVVTRARVWSAFYRDSTLEDSPDPIRDSSGNVSRVEVRRKRKYPHGRLTQVSNNVVLYDGPNPYRFFPVVRVLSQPAPGRFFPVSTAGELLTLQVSADRLDGDLLENAVRLNHGTVVTDTQSGINPRNFQAIPGQIVVTRRGSMFDIKYPPPMPPDMIQHPERLRAKMRHLMGSTDPRAGVASRGNVGGDLAETEISQAGRVTRLRARLLHDSLQRIAEIMFSIMADFFRTPRVIPFIIGGSWEPAVWEPIPDPTGYAVHVDPASIKPQSQTQKAKIAPLLYRLGALDEEEILRELDWPNWKEAAAHAKQRQMMMALAGIKKAAGKQKVSGR